MQRLHHSVLSDAVMLSGVVVASSNSLSFFPVIWSLILLFISSHCFLHFYCASTTLLFSFWPFVVCAFLINSMLPCMDDSTYVIVLQALILDSLADSHALFLVFSVFSLFLKRQLFTTIRRVYNATSSRFMLGYYHRLYFSKCHLGDGIVIHGVTGAKEPRRRFWRVP